MNHLDIHDIKGLVPLPHGWWWLWLCLALLVAGGLVVWLWRRRNRAAADRAPVPRSAYELALEALERLRADQPPVEEFYIRLSDLVRLYLEGQLGLRAPERTTEEFLLEAARDGVLAPAHKESLGAFLQEADLVKFARHRPGPQDTDRALGAAERFIHETGHGPTPAESQVSSAPSPAIDPHSPGAGSAGGTPSPASAAVKQWATADRGDAVPPSS